MLPDAAHIIADKVLQRSERLDLLVDKTELLSGQATRFEAQVCVCGPHAPRDLRHASMKHATQRVLALNLL